MTGPQPPCLVTALWGRKLTRILAVGNPHLVHVDAVGRRVRVTIELHGVGELVGSPAVKRVVRDVQWKTYTVNGESIEVHDVRRGVVVVFSQNVVPRPRCERSEGNGGGIPLFESVVEGPPDAWSVIRLPAEVVHPSTELVLAFELDRLRSGLHSLGNVDVEFVGERVNLAVHPRVL